MRKKSFLNAPLIGVKNGVSLIQTPALVIDLDKFKTNQTLMQRYCDQSNIRLRPHTKTHKCVEIAKRQILNGGQGICCAKLGEAEAMAAGGISDILITSPVVSSPGIDRLINLSRTIDVTVVVDSLRNVEMIGAASLRSDVRINLLLDLDPGLHRTGIPPDTRAEAIAISISKNKHLEFRGLQMYAGHLMHIRSFQERQTKSLQALEMMETFRNRLLQIGIESPIMTGGGTGTINIDDETEILNEIQAGSYLFMDRQYNEIEDRNEGKLPFATSLFVQTTVISANHPNLCTTDAGLKAFATDDKTPILADQNDPSVKYFFFGDEHGGIRWEGNDSFEVGRWLQAETPHCDPTFNLYDVVHVIQGSRLVDIWEIDGRGKSA